MVTNKLRPVLVDPNIGACFLPFDKFLLEWPVQLRVSFASHEQSAEVAWKGQAKSFPCFHESANQCRRDSREFVLGEAPIAVSRPLNVLLQKEDNVHTPR